MKSRETLDSVMWVYIISRRHNLALEAGACGIEGYTCGVIVKPKYRSGFYKKRVKEGLRNVNKMDNNVNRPQKLEYILSDV